MVAVETFSLYGCGKPRERFRPCFVVRIGEDLQPLELYSMVARNVLHGCWCIIVCLILISLF